MFEYFPDNYPWNIIIMSAMNRGAVISEVDEACRPLKHLSSRNDASTQEAWFESWKRVAERVEALAIDDEKAGHPLSSGRKYIRAGLYYFSAERVLKHLDPRRVRAYRQGLAAFKKGLQLRKEPAEWVEIPFQGKSMPAIFSRAGLKGRAPCMVHFDGFDNLKEFLYQASAEEFRRRGISLLIVDHPGVGEALRLRNMPVETSAELPASACLDYLGTRSDVDPNRIGIMANSLGGYYAPRAAAFEKRFKCCVAYGAMWNFGERVTNRLAGRGGTLPLVDWLDQLMWVMGKDTVEAAVEVAKRITLEGIADKITCPLLVMHGENDRQVPLWHAEKTFEAAVNSPNRKLKVFTLAGGGAEHCQADNIAMAVDYMSDWVAENLGGDPKGV